MSVLVGISVDGVKAHLKSMFTKLHAANSTEAVAVAIRNGYLREGSSGTSKIHPPRGEPPSLPARPPRSGLEIEQSFLVTGSGEEVVQISIDLTPVRLMPGDDRFAHILESLQVGPGIPVTEFMVGYHGNPSFEELG